MQQRRARERSFCTSPSCTEFFRYVSESKHSYNMNEKEVSHQMKPLETAGDFHLVANMV